VVEDMMEDYGIQHRIFSVANPHTNARAEFGVKTVLMDIVSHKGDNGQSRGVKSSA
jgi:hypothetical protein